MSALGQKPTYALQQAMSALHPIATAKANFRKGPCPLYPQKRTFWWAECQLSARRGLSQVGLHALKPRADPCLQLCVYYWAVFWGGLKVDGPNDNTKTVEGFENLDSSPV